MNRLTTDDMRCLMTRGWLSLCGHPFAEATLVRSRVQVLEAGEPLFHPGDSSAGLYGVLTGSVAISFVVPEFGPTVAHLMLPGAWLGETALVRGARSVGAHATRATRVAFLSARDVEAVVTQEPRRWPFFAMLAVLNGQLAMGIAHDLMLRDPRQRCIATLLRLAGFRHGMPRPPGIVALDITQADLAQMTNLSRNSVGAILRILREQNCVDVDYGQLIITDPASLARLLSPEA